MEATGRLIGPELACPGGHLYRAGDRVVTLAAGADGGLVTSQRAAVAAVDLSAETLTLRTDEGQQVLLRKEEAGQRTAWITDMRPRCIAAKARRPSGPTSSPTAGAGNWPTWPCPGPASRPTSEWWRMTYPKAVTDLRRDWSTRRTPTWAIDTVMPDRTTLTRERFEALSSDQQARLAALFHVETAIAGNAIVGICLPNRAATLGQAEAALHSARQPRADLDAGHGMWQDSEAGRAVTDLAHARKAREEAHWTADHGARWRDRHAARKEVGRRAEREVDAQQRWDVHVAPMSTRFDQEIVLHQATLDGARNRFEHRQAATRAVISHGLEQQRHARSLAERIAAERNGLDGVPSAAEVRRAPMQRERFRGFEPAAQYETAASRLPGIEI